MNYAINKKRAIYEDTSPTKTDQAAASSSDINIIVGQQLITGYAPGAPKPPMYDDFTNFPNDLREALENARGLTALRGRLPPQLSNKTLDELLRLTTEDITNILTPPPQQPPEPKIENQ